MPWPCTLNKSRPLVEILKSQIAAPFTTEPYQFTTESEYRAGVWLTLLQTATVELTDCWDSLKDSSNLNPKPLTLNPKPYTLHPTPYTLNPKP